MTADPMAPDAAAVYLNRSEITDDLHHLYTFYARIKVLQDKGRKLARVEIPYQLGDSGITSVKPKNIGQDWASTQSASKSGTDAGSAAPETIFKVDGIHGRTIHPDGTIVPLTVRPEDLVTLKSPGGQATGLSFTLPAVEVGSILEYTYTLHYDETHFSAPFWQVQQSYFVHKAHFVFTPFNDFLRTDQAMTNRYLVDRQGRVVNTLIGWPVLPAGVAVKTDSTGQFSLDVTDIPALPQEEWMPPLQNVAYQVRFYYKNASSSSDFWAAEEKRWSRETNHLTEPADSLRQAVTTLTAPGDSPLDRASKLYSAVQELTNTDFTSTPGAAGANHLPVRTAAEVWSRKSGSSTEMALLYLALLRAAGLTAYDMKVVDRDKGVFSSGYLSFDQFDSDLVILSLDGKEIFLDPGEKDCPFQTVHWKHAGASGIRQTANGVAVATTPLLPYTATRQLRAGDITFDSPTHFTGSFRFVMTGQNALYWRQQVQLHGADQAKQHFDAWLRTMVPQGVQAHFDHFLALDKPDLNLIAIVLAEGSLADGNLTLPGFFFEAGSRPPFVDEAQRQEPVDMHYGEQITDQIVYHLPAGVTVASAPDSAKISLPPYAAFATAVSSAPGQLTVTRTLARAFTLASTAQYPELRGFYQKVAASDQQTIVLRAAQ